MTAPKSAALTAILEEQKGLNQFLGIPESPELLEMQEKIFDAIDDTADGTPAEIDALKFGAVLLLSPPFLLDDTTRFEAFDPEYMAVVDDVLRSDDAFDAQGGITPAMPKNLARIMIAIAIGAGRQTVSDLHGGTMTQDEIDEAKAAAKEPDPAEQRKLCDAADCPAMERELVKIIADIKAALNALPGPASKRGPHTGPRPPQP